MGKNILQVVLMIVMTLSGVSLKSEECSKPNIAYPNIECRNNHEMLKHASTNPTRSAIAVTLKPSDKNEDDLEATITPNPANGPIEIRFNKVVDKIEIRIIDVSGTEIYKQSHQSIDKLVLDLHEHTGLFMVEITEPQQRSYYQLRLDHNIVPENPNLN